MKAKSRPGRMKKGGGRWINELPEEFRPSKPIHFEAVLPISAKNGQLGDLHTVMKDIHRRLHPLEHTTFDEERILAERNKQILV